MNSPLRREVGDADLNSRVARLEAEYEWLARELLDARADWQTQRKEPRNRIPGLTVLGQYLEGAGIGVIILIAAFSLVLVLGNI